MLDWLIIGGGIHGTHISFQLVGRGIIPADRLRVLDPHSASLARWQQFTNAVGMEYLRSPIVHNLHWDQGALGLFSRIHEGAPDVRFIPPYGRPSLPLFNRHNQHIIDKYRLHALRLQGWAKQLNRLPNGAWQVDTDRGEITARKIVLALGLSEQPHIPDWAANLMGSAPIQHIFSPSFNRSALAGQVAVIGGGITAAQVALAIAASENATVCLIRRHAERIHDFDADTGWMNAINLRGFANITDWAERRRVIKQARHRGSVPPEVAAGLRTASQAGALHIVSAAVESAVTDGQAITLHLSDGSAHTFDHVVLATGFNQNRPGGQFLDDAIERHGLPTAPDGYPIITPALEWAAGLHVSGPLAELEVGPASRNILGARMAGSRIYNIA
jgi:glycine/D-amino acid oxidase-like deaminating enzyme